jgi:hypothetical protein
MTGYCFKCKSQRELNQANEVTMKNKRRAMRGQCAACGSTVYRFVPRPLSGGEGT